MDKFDRWEYAINNLLGHEGGLSDNKSDPGGITNYGISLRYLKSVAIDVNGDGGIDAQDIRAITRDKAVKIYLDEWWLKYHYDTIENYLIASKVLDMSVNMGSSRAHKILQEALNNVLGINLAIDGKLGSKSFFAISQACSVHEGHDLLNELRDLSAKFYISLTQKDPELKVFLKGWLRRASA